MRRYIVYLIMSMCVLFSFAQETSIVISQKGGRRTVIHTEDIDSVWFTSVDTISTSTTQSAASAASATGNSLKYYNNDGKLKILAIGNSFAEDGTVHLGNIIAEAGIKDSDVEIYRFIAGGTSLEFWDDCLLNNRKCAIYKVYGNDNPYNDSQLYTLPEVLSHDWDIIVLQQLSSIYYDTTTYEPFLTDLMTAARRYSKGYPHFAWQMVWSRDSHTGTGEIYGDTGWENNVAATKYVMSNYNIDILIPTGTAIQNARHTSVCTATEFTRDGQHLDYGAGRYIAEMTWFTTLVAPFFSSNIYNIDYMYSVPDYEKEWSQNTPTDVTHENVDIFKSCVTKAVVNPYGK